MKYLQRWETFAVLTGLLIAWYVITRNKETFVPEFLDEGNLKSTVSSEKSSYAQKTNHFQMTTPAPEPIEGTQTPFRVNMYNAYMQ